MSRMREQRSGLPLKVNASVVLAPIESPSPHNVSDIINSFFAHELTNSSEQLSDKDTALAKLGKERQGKDKYQKKLDLYFKLEHHIQQAIVKQLAEQESQLRAVQERYPTFDNPHLLQEPCHLSQYLDEKTLRAEGLLVPSDYHSDPLPSQNPPHRDWPAYMEGTVTSRLHARIQCLPKKNPVKLPPVWKNSMSSEEREIAKKSLSELYRKREFPENPRYSKHSGHTNTASFGSLKKRKTVKGSSIGDGHKKVLKAEPPEILFTDYVPGKTYESILILKNISDTSRQLTITPPSTSYFKASLIQFPTVEGVIAPGMSCSYSISFSPDSLADFSDKIKVLSHVGEVLAVPLIGFRLPPNLSVPLLWQSGHCLVKGYTLLAFTCCNDGGDGSFRLTSKSDIAESSVGVLSVGPFTITPTEFSLPTGIAIDIKVTFQPLEVTKYSSQIVMTCDNGQTNIITLAGTGEMVDISCIYISPSTSSASTVLEYIAGYTGLTNEPVDVIEAIDNPVIQFEPMNPGVGVYQVAVIKNNNNVPLAYEWKFYHPRTELIHTDGSTELTPPLSYHSSPFSVDDSRGILLPREVKPFTFCLKSNENDTFECMAYLELMDIPEASLDSSKEGSSWIRINKEDNKGNIKIAAICINLQGHIEPYAVQFSPPLICFPEELPPCTKIIKHFTMNNHSLCDVKIDWSPVTTAQVNITVEPNNNTIVPGGTCYCELVVCSSDKKGAFNIPLECSIEHSKFPSILHIKGRVKCPVVTVDIPCVEFGLVQLGKSVSGSFQITNHSCCPVQYELRQIVVASSGEEGSCVDYECLDMCPSIGEITVESSIVVTVQCSPKLHCGHLRTAIECLAQGERLTVLEVTAEVQRPMLLLAESTLYINSCYKTVPVTHTLTLINTTLLPTYFQWINEQRDHTDLQFTPDHGPIGPHERVTVELQTIWKTKGDHTGVIAVCCAQGMNYPVVLSLSAHVLGPSVDYTIGTLRDDDSSLPLEMDFGSFNRIREPQCLLLTVTNTSAIAGRFTVFVRQLSANHLLAPETDIKPKSLLQPTVNIAKASSKTKKQVMEELMSNLLSDGRGACFTVEPSDCTLIPFQSQLVTVTAYADMWGQYSDQLICKVAGVDAKTIPIHYGVISSPIYFQPTATFNSTLIRLGCQPAGSHLVKRTVHLTNVSSTVIQIDWRTFYIDPKDDKVIDFVSYIGHPFSTPDAQDDKHNPPKIPPSFRVHLFPHEGKPTDNIFAITPKQLVMNPHSRTSVEVTFDPSITAYNEIGEQVNGYILGYMTINYKPSLHISRVQGYDIKPVRIDVSASITHPRLILNTGTDDSDLSFFHLASEFLLNDQVADEMIKTHSFSLINQTLTNLTFHTLPLASPLMVSLTLNKEDSVMLKSRHSIEGSILVSLTHQSFLDLINNKRLIPKKLTLKDTLTVVYSTGARQEFPIDVVICLPFLSVYPALVDYETCFIRKSVLSSFQLRNCSSSPTRWTISTPEEWLNIIQVEPHFGTIQPGSQTIQVTFTPQTELQYSIVLFITDEITQYSFTVTITGRGSADERYKRQRRK